MAEGLSGASLYGACSRQSRAGWPAGGWAGGAACPPSWRGRPLLPVLFRGQRHRWFGRHFRRLRRGAGKGGGAASSGVRAEDVCTASHWLRAESCTVLRGWDAVASEPSPGRATRSETRAAFRQGPGCELADAACLPPTLQPREPNLDTSEFSASEFRPLPFGQLSNYPHPQHYHAALR